MTEPSWTLPAPRLAPLAPKEWPPEMRDALAALKPANPRLPMPPPDPNRPKALNLLGVFALHPVLTEAYNRFNGHLLFGSSLSARLRELLVLRVAAVREATYEWRQHVVLAGDADITPDEIAAIAAGPDAWSGFDALEAAVLTAVDELVADALITDGTWAVLAEGLEVEQLMDLVFTVGAYDLLAMAFRSFGVQLDADLQ